MELKCQVKNPGIARLDVRAATASEDVVDTIVAETEVVALADLKLEVGDPAGPVPQGEEAEYTIRVHNRGTNTAEQVNVVALFSEGIEPRTAEGGQFTIADGRVTFRTIDSLAAGREIVLTIRAQAKVPGTHVFRAEVFCNDLSIKLAAEETTRFFADEVLGVSPSNARSTERIEAFGPR
jgi:hypothetical protein